jgi:hypothetical protein
MPACVPFMCSVYRVFETLKMNKTMDRAIDARRESKIRKGETLLKSSFKNNTVFLILPV